MARSVTGKLYLPLAAGAVFFCQNALAADEERLRLPGQDAVGQETRAGLTPQGPAGNVTFLSVNTGVGETDNAFRTEGNKVSQTLAVVGGDFDFRRVSRSFDAELTGDLSYVNYLQNAFKSTLFGRFDGSGGWVLIPETLRWSIDDSFGQSQLDPLNAVTPANLENVNVVSTGPDLVLRPAQAWFLKLGARYAYATFQTSPFDHKRLLGDVSVGRDLSAASKVSANADFQRIEFQNTQVNADYDRRNFYAEYSVRGARTELTGDLGASQAQAVTPPDAVQPPAGQPLRIYRPIPPTWDTTAYVRVRIVRTVSAASALQLNLGRQYTDLSDAFRGLQTGASGRIVIQPSVGTSSNYLTQYANVVWTTQYKRTTINLSGSYERNTYLTDVDRTFNVDRESVQARAVRRLTSVLDAELSASAARERFFVQGSSDNDYVGTVALSYKPARRLEFKLRYEHESRVASGAAVGFSENRAMLTVGYRILPTHDVAPANPG